MKITTGTLDWKTAKKTQPLKAKQLISLMIDRSVMNKFLLDTLEGNEVLGDGAVVCIGGAGDAWQQMPAKLLAKYNVTAIDVDGWMLCEPKPENLINVCEVDASMCQDGKFYILGHFGVESEDGLRQYGSAGDFIGQNRDDASDVWVIRRKIFLNTYQLTK